MSETLLNNRYRLIAQQGSGGMAVIYKAIDIELGRTVAVKILRPSLTNDPEFLKRFRNEARNVANLGHPNIVTVYDVGSEDQTQYIVMEFIDGSDLKKLIRKEGALSIDTAVELAIQICAGIGFAHRAGLVHADVKPQNVLLTSTRQVKVTDFGIAQAFTQATQTAEREAVVWGSPHYFAPEQARGEKPTPASDVYSIGIVLFEMLTGQLPYTGGNQQELAMAHIRTDIPHVMDFAPHVPESLDRIVYKVMSKEPIGRYRMADQLGQILVNYRDRSQQNTLANPRVPTSTTPEPQAPQAPLPPPPENRPLYKAPNASSSEPTVRYNVVPEAPPPPPNVYKPQKQPSISENTPASGVYPQSTSHYRRSNTTATSSSGIDILTIVMAFLALVSVACLIPLYILVFQAYR